MTYIVYMQATCNMFKLLELFTVVYIVVKNLRNRWGSLTKKGVVNLNLNLIKAPEDVIDYVVLHELCHLKIKEHSHHYWDLLHKYMPNYHDKIE